MITIQLLEAQDIILETDYTRQLSLLFTGQSDYLAKNSTYGGSPLNRLGWLPAKYQCPYWVGKTVGEFNTQMLEISSIRYEFVRGAIPREHYEKLTREELRLLEYSWGLHKK